MTEFEKALASLPVASRSSAAEIRKTFQLHEDDAVWAIYGTFQAALGELPHICAEAGRRGVRDWSVATGKSRPPVPFTGSVSTRAERELRAITCASAYVAGTVLIGSTCYTLGAIATTGRAGWLGAAAAERGPIAYSLGAILSAPVGGALVLSSLVLLAAALVVARISRARLGAVLHASAGNFQR